MKGVMPLKCEASRVISGMCDKYRTELTTTLEKLPFGTFVMTGSTGWADEWKDMLVQITNSDGYRRLTRVHDGKTAAMCTNKDFSIVDVVIAIKPALPE